MIPFGNERVTLIARSERADHMGRRHAEYSAYILNGCSWRRTARAYLSDRSMAFAEEVVCRIPAGQQKPQAGDMLIRGDAYEAVQSARDYEEIIERYRGQDGAFIVSAVADNARPGVPMPHYAAKG